MALFGIPVVGLFFCLAGTELWRDARQVLFFKRTVGIVTRYTAPDPGAAKDQIDGRLEFTYSVGGETRDGSYPPKDVLRMPRLPYPLLSHDWHPQDKLTVFYDRSEPAVCTLEPRIEPAPFFVFTFLAPFVAFIASGFFRGIKSIELQDVGRGIMLAGGTILLPAYFVLSVVAAFAYVLFSKYFSWQFDLAIGLLLPTVIVPGVVWGIARWTRQSRSEADRPTGSTGANGGWRTQFIVLGSATVFVWPLIALFVWHISIAPVVEAFPLRDRYQQTIGRIVESRLEKASSSRSTGYKTVVVYSYMVNRQQYRGGRISLAGEMLTSKADQIPILDRYPLDAPVTVYYNPDDPRQAVLDPSIVKHQLFFDFFIVPFFLLGVLLLQATFKTIAGTRWSWSKRTVRATSWFLITHIISTLVLSFAGASQPDRAWLVIFGAGADLAAVALALIKPDDGLSVSSRVG